MTEDWAQKRGSNYSLAVESKFARNRGNRGHGSRWRNQQHAGYQSQESTSRRYLVWSEPRKPHLRFRVEKRLCLEPESQSSRPLDGAEQRVCREGHPPSPAQAPALKEPSGSLKTVF